MQKGEPARARPIIHLSAISERSLRAAKATVMCLEGGVVAVEPDVPFDGYTRRRVMSRLDNYPMNCSASFNWVIWRSRLWLI